VWDLSDPKHPNWRNEMSVGDGSWFLIEEYELTPDVRGGATAS
jgi:hypothetical protein